MAAHDSTTATGTRSITPQAAPRRRHYSPRPVSSPFDELPFVARRPRVGPGGSNWNVPPTDDYGLACKIGIEYAGHLVQYLKDNPNHVGSNVLGVIVAAMNFADEGAAKGYHVGFFTHLERLLYAQAARTDVFSGVDAMLAEYAAFEERIKRETSRHATEPAVGRPE